MLNGGSCEKVVRSGDEAKETSEGRETCWQAERHGQVPVSSHRTVRWEVMGWMDDNVFASRTPFRFHVRR